MPLVSRINSYFAFMSAYLYQSGLRAVKQICLLFCCVSAITVSLESQQSCRYHRSMPRATRQCFQRHVLHPCNIRSTNINGDPCSQASPVLISGYATATKHSAGFSHIHALTAAHTCDTTSLTSTTLSTTAGVSTANHRR